MKKTLLLTTSLFGISLMTGCVAYVRPYNNGEVVYTQPAPVIVDPVPAVIFRAPPYPVRYEYTPIYAEPITFNFRFGGGSHRHCR